MWKSEWVQVLVIHCLLTKHISADPCPVLVLFWLPAWILALSPLRWSEALLPGGKEKGQPSLCGCGSDLHLRWGVIEKRGVNSGGASRVRFCSLLGIQAVTVVLFLVEIFSRAPPMLEVDLTHTGPFNAVSLVTGAGYEPPRSAQGINSFSASYMPSYNSLPALGIMGKTLEREH